MGPSQLSAESEKDKGLQLEGGGKEERETERKLFFLLLATSGAREENPMGIKFRFDKTVDDRRRRIRKIMRQVGNQRTKKP